MDEHAVPSLICEQFCTIADALPHWIALSCGSSTMSYGELERRSAKFASYLSQSGVAPGSTVAICMDRSFELIVAALGVLRSGSAYVPLDQGWSVDRLRFAIEDSGSALLVAPEELINRLALRIPSIDPRTDAPAIEAAGEIDPKAIHPEDLAYLIYTSGSTGVPKGVEITHRNLAHLVAWHQAAFSLKPQDRMSHVAGLGFDAAVWEIWPALATGATLCLPEDAVRSSPDLLRQWLCQERVTVSFAPTALAKPMITTPWPATASLRFLLTGGDVLPRGPIEGLPFRVINNYGPTECTVVATSGAIVPGAVATPPIGQEIAGTSIYLLDEQKQPVPDGVAGEIYIGGNGVGRGYRGQPGLTGRFFLADPFVPVPGARMYRTGDMAIRQANGDLNFRGRIDRQVKVRGQRVELDEISSVLGRHPGIEFATAIALQSPVGETQLVAHVLPKQGAPVPATTELQKFLLLSVPPYMVPSTFVLLHSLPVSSNGKIDFSRLQSPDEITLLPGVSGRLPGTVVEEKLLAIVQELLDSKTVSVEDDFFLVGGHSLIGMQLIMRLRETFGVKVTLRQLFQSPTVERLADQIESILIESVSALSDDEAGMLLAE